MALPGFPEIDTDVKPEEVPIAELIALGLNARIGKANAITNKSIREALKKKGIKVNGVKVRAMISYIRVNNLVPALCSCGKGYYKADTDQEWEEWTTSAQCRIDKQQAILDVAKFYNDVGNEKL